MKILYVENALIGHHIPYLQALCSSKEWESVVITPTEVPGISRKQILFSMMDFHSKKLGDYLKCLRRIEEVAAEEKVDVIHFLDGDKIMRHFGIGMDRLSAKYSVVITFHHLFPGLIRRISYMGMGRGRCSVVHTDVVQSRLKEYGLKYVEHVEYPSFHPIGMGREHNPEPVIGMYGDTRREKGLDILLKALQKVKADFRLIIAGKETEITAEEIRSLMEPYKEKVELDLKFLSEKELSDNWERTDLVVLPYTFAFDGASGQLTEGVRRGLPILGSAHGSLGRLIREHHLGKTFETGNVEELSQLLEQFLNEPFTYDEQAKDYQKQLSPERFLDDYGKVYQRVKSIKL